MLFAKKGEGSFPGAPFYWSPALIFLNGARGHGVGFDDAGDWAYLSLHKVHGVLMVVGFKPDATVPSSEDVVRVVQCHTGYWLLRKPL